MARGWTGWSGAVLTGAMALAGCGGTELVQEVGPGAPPLQEVPSAPDSGQLPPVQQEPDAGTGTRDAEVPDSDAWPQAPRTAGDYVGVGPQSLTIADFNGDGAPDVAVALSGRGFSSQYKQHPGSVRVFLNDGKGRLGAPAFSTRALLPDGVAVGDVNGDGRADLLHFVRYGAHLLVGGGDGTFDLKPVLDAASAFPSTPDFGSGTLAGFGSAGSESWAHFVSWRYGEYRRSGRGGLYRLLAAGDGTLTGVELLTEEGASLARSDSAARVAAADFDADGQQDFAVVDEGALGLYLRTAPGRVKLSTRVSTGPGLVFAHDVDRDGHVDVVLETGSELRVMRGDGKGGLAAAASFPHAGNTEKAKLLDVDGDGHHDLLGLQPGLHVLSILWGQPDGSFGQESRLALDSTPSDVAVADLDGDGARELLVTEWERNVLTRHALPARAQREPDPVSRSCPLGWGAAATCSAALTRLATLEVGAPGMEPAFADLDGDGWLDVAAPAAQRGVRVLVNEGAGRFRPQLTAEGALVTRLSAGDLDGDGRVDLAADYTLLGGETDGWYAPGLGILRNEGDAQLRPGETALVAGLEPERRGGWRVDAADFDADGRVDIALMAQGQYVPWAVRLMQQPDGSFRTRGLTDYCYEPDDQSAGVERPLIADFDRDGRLDYAYTTFGLNLGYTAADGTEREGEGYATGSARYSADGQGRSLSAADVDGDGFVDVLTSSFTAGEVLLYRGDAGGTLQAPARCTLAAQGDHESLDVDGDGRADLVGLEPLALTVRRGAGQGRFSAAQRIVLEARPLRVWAVDLLVRGRPQLAVLLANGQLVLLDAGCP